MAAYNSPLPHNHTLTSTTVDVCTVTGAVNGVLILNRDAVNTLWYTTNNVAPVAEDQNSIPILPNTSGTAYLKPVSTQDSAILQVLGNAGKYSILSALR